MDTQECNWCGVFGSRMFVRKRSQSRQMNERLHVIFCTPIERSKKVPGGHKFKVIPQMSSLHMVIILKYSNRMNKGQHACLFVIEL